MFKQTNKLNLISLPTIIKKCVQYSTGTEDFIARRALMYVPGHDQRKIDKAFKLDLDCMMLDCEDGVAINKKGDARDNIKRILNSPKPTKPRNYDLGVRVNAIDTDLFHDDVKSVLSAKYKPDTVCLPKVHDTNMVKEFGRAVKEHLGENRVNLIMIIESAKAMMDVADICKTAFDVGSRNNFKPVALIFGGDDYLADIGATKSSDCTELLYARQKLVSVAKAFKLQAIDIVHIQYKDLVDLRRQSEQGAGFGFTGKQVIHPDQVPIVQRAFMPNGKMVEWAQGVLAAFEENQKSGKGAFTFKGSMIDMPTVKQAENIINLHKLS